MPYADPEAQRAYQREWKARRREEWMAGRTCIDCGTAEGLTIDHRDRSTKVEHRIWSWREDRLLAELAKCDVRCEDCHSARHAPEWHRHGTSRYDAGCRCSTCRTAKAAKNRRYRESKAGAPAS